MKNIINNTPYILIVIAIAILFPYHFWIEKETASIIQLIFLIVYASLIFIHVDSLHKIVYNKVQDESIAKLFRWYIVAVVAIFVIIIFYSRSQENFYSFVVKIVVVLGICYLEYFIISKKFISNNIILDRKMNFISGAYLLLPYSITFPRTDSYKHILIFGAVLCITSVIFNRKLPFANRVLCIHLISIILSCVVVLL